MTEDKTKPQKDYLTTTELARLCGVSRFTIINWVNRGKIRAIRTVGRQYRIPVSEAISFLESCHNEFFNKSKNMEKPNDGKIDITKKIAKEKKDLLYRFSYNVGCGIQGLKGRIKDLKKVVS